ncbi:MAG: LamG domain-containing protein, partial [Bdellovibrionaceae bacterium]|nr:LamG domain-containing protein [Pseudobdellovibrionaceae bacterium]
MGDPSPNHFDPGNASYSVSFWFKRTDTNSGIQYLIGKGHKDDQKEGWAVFLYNNYLYIRACHTDGILGRAACTGPSVNNTNWHHVLFVINRQEGKLQGYLDGSSTGWIDGTILPFILNNISSWGEIDNNKPLALCRNLDLNDEE